RVLSGSRPAITTVAPRWARRRAVTRPMPLVAPVTSMNLPARGPSISVLLRPGYRRRLTYPLYPLYPRRRWRATRRSVAQPTGVRQPGPPQGGEPWLGAEERQALGVLWAPCPMPHAPCPMPGHSRRPGPRASATAAIGLWTLRARRDDG